MSIRRKTDRRLTLVRACGVCGRQIITSAASPLMRQLIIEQDGKRRQITTYFCSRSCMQSTYKHLFDGLADVRRKEKESKRDVREKNHKYYMAHADEIKAKKRAQYWANPEESRATVRYNHKKRALHGGTPSWNG